MKRSSDQFNNTKTLISNEVCSRKQIPKMNFMKKNAFLGSFHEFKHMHVHQNKQQKNGPAPVHGNDSTSIDQRLTQAPQYSKDGQNSSYRFEILTGKYHINHQLQNKQNKNNLNTGLGIIKHKPNAQIWPYQCPEDDQQLQQLDNQIIQINMSYQFDQEDKQNQDNYIIEEEQSQINRSIDNHLCFVSQCKCDTYYHGNNYRNSYECERCSTIQQVTEPTSSFHNLFAGNSPQNAFRRQSNRNRQQNNKEFIIYKVNNTDLIANNTRNKMKRQRS